MNYIKTCKCGKQIKCKNIISCGQRKYCDGCRAIRKYEVECKYRRTNAFYKIMAVIRATRYSPYKAGNSWL